MIKRSLLAITVLAALSGCSLDGDDGKDGATGAQGTNGADGSNGVDGLNLAVLITKLYADGFIKKAPILYKP